MTDLPPAAPVAAPDDGDGPAGPAPDAPVPAPVAPEPPPDAPVPPTVDDQAPWREARRRVAAAWVRGGAGTRIAIAVGAAVAAALLGAFLFGLWHVVVGGLVKGNWNAAGFGFALAGVSGVLLWIEASIARRLLPAAG